ncbi:TPA: hypothetical protein RQN45_005233 [Klebsiella oxytoca]|nr:hypothetical protein [Klebsiella oxytoca]HEJ8155949.1 hypothetical protein [Klebsiella oxytoca]
MNFTDWLILNQYNGDIVKAIESLRPSTDYVKDYIFPVAIAFASAFFGGVSAVYINRRQELQKIARDNLMTSIQAIILAHDCLNNLVSIKTNYLNIDSDEPLIRFSQFTTIITKFDNITFNSNSLYFIRQIPTANKNLIESFIWKVKHRILRMKIKNPSSEDLRGTWRNTVRVSAMFGNYNEAMSLLKFRNELNEQVKDKVLMYGHGDDIAFEEVQHILGKKLCTGIIDITETCIALIDHLIVEFYHFLLEFPAVAESNIELGRVREWGRVPTYENKQEIFLKCLEPIKQPDFKKFFAYTGMTEQEARVKYTFKSWFD